MFYFTSPRQWPPLGCGGGGTFHTAGDGARRGPGNPEMEKWRPKHSRLNIFAQHEMLMAPFPRPQPPAEDIPIYNGRGCTLLELSQGKCRWPISNPGAEDFCFCGNEPVKGLPYCLGHARIAYRSVGRQRSNAGA
jgi:GcrA cell cycle regulator